MGLGQGLKEDFDRYEKLCEEATWQDKTLNEIAQQRQNDWFGVWVGEMVRIAKPGAPVIVEQVSYPLCEAFFDWGGVSQEFWTNYAVQRYGWDINPSSIEFEDDRLFRKRYHVFMRKNGFNASKSEAPFPVPGPGNEDKGADASSGAKPSSGDESKGKGNGGM